MIIVSDMTPLHYLILTGCDHVLPVLFDRVLAPPAVIREMSDPKTPEAVRRWVAAPPGWLEIREPTHIEDIPRLGRGRRGAGEKAAIAPAHEVHADALLMDDAKAIQEARKRGLRPIRMLTVLDAAAERGLLDNLAEVFDHLENGTPFYVGPRCKAIIEDMKRRDSERKRAPG